MRMNARTFGSDFTAADLSMSELGADFSHANFTNAEAGAMASEDPDYHMRDLFNTIERGDHASWTLEMQIMPFGDAWDYRFNPFDLTKVWPHGDYPSIKVGRMVLNRNPENYFAEVEQAAFEPANMVPGIGPSPDKMLLGRLFSYPDTHRYRIGTNYLQLPINQPRVEVHSYNKDGSMRYRHNGEQPVYAPNSFSGPRANAQLEEPGWFVSGEIARSAYEPHREDDDFVQPRALWNSVLSETDRAHLVANLVSHLKAGVRSDIVARVVEYWRNVHPNLGDGVARGMGLPVAEERTGSGARPGA